ncbi:hypothetical protein B5X24_HaOG207780 [Helicoverpa armigera]|nr:hypothetical protein B5X24_HaOG207780 [Helicoverpa armigera]
MTTPKLLYTIEQPHGMGELYFLWQKGESHSLLATTGTDATVAVHDRSGQLMERMKLQGLCAGMEWDQDGDYLAIITPNSNTVLLWECHANKRINIETGLREPPSCIAWAYGEPLLAVGTQKGNLALYNHHTTKLKLIAIWNNGEVSGSVMPAGGAERCAWSSDGRLLATAGRAYLNVYVTALPPLHAAYGTRVITLTSLTEATVYQCIAVGDEPEPVNKSEPAALATYTLPTEPSVIALGGSHVCCASGTLAWFYPLAGGAATRRQYPAAIDVITLAGDYAAALFQGRAMLHAIDQVDPSQPEKEAILFPEPHMQGAKIVDIHLTSDFFIFVTDQGHVEYFGVEEWRSCGRWRHACGVRGVYCDIGGARACVLDERRRVHVYCPAPDHVCALQRSQAADVRGIIWDICLSDRNVFIIYTDEAIETYYYAANSINGSHIDLVGITPLLAGQIPLILFSGDVYCYGSGGTVLKLALDSHNTSGLADADTEKRLANQRRHIDKLLALRRFSEAWLFCDAVDEPELWRKMGEAAIAELNVEFAIRVYTRLSDVAMVWALEDASHIEDLSILCGTLCACLCQGSAAARWLESSPAGALHALELHAARGDWARAADIAAVSCPAKAPAITLHRAQHLELTADYHEALSNYEKSLITENTDDIKVKEHNDKCEAGIARMSIRCGDVMRGLTTAMKHSHDIMLVKECAQLLEEEKQYTHAAALYDQAGNTEKAASLYIKLKSWLKVEALLPKINSPSIHIQYAKAKEAEGRYHDALKSYLKAQDYEAAIRLNLDKLDDIDEAVNLVQETKSIQGAKMVANYFQNSDDPTSAIKFLVMSLCYDEAFQLARKNGKLQLYGEILIQTSQARPEDFKSLALHFEGEKNHLLAGKFYFHAGEYSKAMSHLLRSGGSEEEDNEAISIAIDAAAASDDERLTRRLIEFLLGETDGTPREPRHLFRLYMAKRQFAEAAKTAIIIAGAECRAGKYREARDVVRAMCVSLRASRMPVPRDMRHAIALLHSYILIIIAGAECRAGKYREARDVVRAMCVSLRASRMPVPRDMRHAIALLHSYILVRTHVKRGRHDLAARLLLRTAADVTFFPTPQHQVSILTSTVIECSRAGLKHQAYHWARVLMQPEYRSQIDPKYVKKIESVVRHGARDPPAPAVTSPCPQCSAALPQAELTCARCEADVPFCLASGLHIVKDDLTACPECDFPAILSEFVEILQEEGKCPMCGENVDYRRLVKIDDVAAYMDLNTTE